jgi:hypothetical protein
VPRLRLGKPTPRGSAPPSALSPWERAGVRVARVRAWADGQTLLLALITKNLAPDIPQPLSRKRLASHSNDRLSTTSSATFGWFRFTSPKSSATQPARFPARSRRAELPATKLPKTHRADQPPYIVTPVHTKGFAPAAHFLAKIPRPPLPPWRTRSGSPPATSATTSNRTAVRWSSPPAA